MANTERFNTLQLVVAARKKANQLRQKPGLDPAQKNLVDAAYDTLVDAEDTLVLADLKGSVKQLRNTAGELGGLVKRMNKPAQQLKQLIEKIGVAANALGTLADIVSKAAGAGIL